MASLRPGVTNPYASPTEEIVTDPNEEFVRQQRKAYDPGMGFQGMLGKLTPQPIKGGRQTNMPTVTPVPLPNVTMPKPAPAVAFQDMWWLKPGALDHVVPGGRESTTYTFADGRVGHAIPSGMRSTAGSGYGYGPKPGFGGFQGFMGRFFDPARGNNRFGGGRYG